MWHEMKALHGLSCPGDVANIADNTVMIESI
jgi:hypothetical protein